MGERPEHHVVVVGFLCVLEREFAVLDALLARTLATGHAAFLVFAVHAGLVAMETSSLLVDAGVESIIR